MKRKLILFELNEVPLRIVDDFCARHPGSALAGLMNRSQQFETVAEDHGHLSPWITWPSVHRGVSNVRHGIECFGQPLDPVDRTFPPVWNLLAARGVRTGVFGSLHSYASRALAQEFAFYVPDTFAAGSECFPKKLAIFQEFNLAMVQDSPRNVSARIHWPAALKLLASAPGLGLKPHTLLDVGCQLVNERRNAARRVRRRTYQALLAFDIFFAQLKRTLPDFVTFFTNHVASAMHRYWAASFPGDYQEFGFDAQWVAAYGDEIGFALRKLDRCLARLRELVDRRPEYQLWITTSMGQAATTAQPMETQLYMVEPGRFLAALGVPDRDWSRRPAMAPDTNFVVSESYQATVANRLATLRINGQGVEWRRGENGFFSVRLGQPNLAHQPHMVTLGDQQPGLEQLGLAHVEIEDRSGTTAYHIPQGLLMVYDPRTAAIEQPRSQVSTLDIAPAILRYFAAPLPAYMYRTRRGIAA